MTDAERDFTRQKLAAMDRVRCDSNLSASIRTVGAEMFSLCVYELGYAYPSEQYLVEKLGISVRTVKMAVKALQEAGYFRVEKHGRNNVYRPLFDQGVRSSENKQVQKLHLSENQQVQKLPLSEPDRCKKRPEQVQKTSPNRCKKRTPISLEISLGASARGGAERAGEPNGAGAPAPDHPDPHGRLRQRLGEAVFASWFANAWVVSIADGILTLAAPTAFTANYIRTQYDQALLDCWRADGVERVEIVVAAKSAPVSSAPPQAPDARWLIETGRHIVAKRLFVGADKADRAIVEWLKRCGNDATGLRAILAAADARDLAGDDFRSFVKQQTRALHHAGQAALQFPPMVVKRRAS
jgi:hypothetical protein